MNPGSDVSSFGVDVPIENEPLNFALQAVKDEPSLMEWLLTTTPGWVAPFCVGLVVGSGFWLMSGRRRR